MAKIDIQELSNYNLFVEVKNDFLKLIKNKIRKRFSSIRKFILFNKSFSASFYYNVFNSKRRTKISFWLKLCQFLDINLECFKSNIIKIKSRTGFLLPETLPIKLSESLASLVGHALGDGHVSKKISYFSYTNKSIELQNEVKHIISSFCIFKCDERYYKALNIQYPSLVAVILHLLGAPNGNKITKDFLIPKWILNGSRNIKIAFLRALFGDEATVKKSSYEILFKLSKNELYLDSLLKFMNQIKQLLEDVDIEVTSIRRGNIHKGKNGKTIQLVLGIHGYKNFLKFLNIISFSHPRKCQELKELINNYQTIKLRKGKGQSLLYEKLNKPKTIYNLAKELNMSSIAVYKHLRKLQNRGLAIQNKLSSRKPAIWSRI